MKKYTDKKIGEIAFKLYGLTEGDQDWYTFIEGFKYAMRLVKDDIN